MLILRRHLPLSCAHGLQRRPLCVAASSVNAPAKAVAPKRVRQHVNPLARQYLEPITVPDWRSLFSRPELPIHLDIGCARGKYLNSLAAQFADQHNFLGVEIRQSVLDEANQEATARGLRNIAFVHANMSVHQRALLTSLPAPVQSVSIFHPDPWMKKRHIKRRLVNSDFVGELATLLGPGTPVYLQTDVEELFAYMVEVFEESRLYTFEPLDANPFPIPTDREKYVRHQGGDIFRVKLIVGSDSKAPSS